MPGYRITINLCSVYIVSTVYDDLYYFIYCAIFILCLILLYVSDTSIHTSSTELASLPYTKYAIGLKYACGLRSLTAYDYRSYFIIIIIYYTVHFSHTPIAYCNVRRPMDPTHFLPGFPRFSLPSTIHVRRKVNAQCNYNIIK